jgi:hypothetical protein
MATIYISSYWYDDTARLLSEDAWQEFHGTSDSALEQRIEQLKAEAWKIFWSDRKTEKIMGICFIVGILLSPVTVGITGFISFLLLFPVVILGREAWSYSNAQNKRSRHLRLLHKSAQNHSTYEEYRKSAQPM